MICLLGDAFGSVMAMFFTNPACGLVGFIVTLWVIMVLEGTEYGEQV